jgi:hypothetical protein
MATKGGPRNIPPSRQQPPAYDSPQPRGGRQRQSIVEAVAKSFIRSIASNLGRIIARALTGRMR